MKKLLLIPLLVLTGCLEQPPIKELCNNWRYANYFREGKHGWEMKSEKICVLSSEITQRPPNYR